MNLPNANEWLRYVLRRHFKARSFGTSAARALPDVKEPFHHWQTLYRHFQSRVNHPEDLRSRLIFVPFNSSSDTPHLSGFRTPFGLPAQTGKRPVK